MSSSSRDGSKMNELLNSSKFSADRHLDLNVKSLSV